MIERLKALRKELKMTQQDFADKLSIQRSTYSKYEIGQNEPTSAVIALICDRFRVNEEWLRTGDGDMFRQTEPDDEIQQLVDGLMESDDLKRRLVSAIVKLDASQLNAAVEWMKDTFDLVERSVPAADREPTIDEKVESYRRELEQQEAIRKLEASQTGSDAAPAEGA